MREHLGKIVLALGVVAVLLLSTVAYKVDELSDIVLVKTFQEVTTVHVGSQPDQAGLHFKWPYPFQRIVRYDMRAQLLEAPLTETSTQDKYNVVVGMFCSWRIADPRLFNKKWVETERGDIQIRQQLQAAGNAAVAQYDMSQLINTDADKMKLGEIEQKTQTRMQKELDEWGIQVVRVGIKSITLAGETAISEAINLQKEERAAAAKALEAAGQSEAEAIRARARAARETILSFADRKAAEIRSRGMQQAAEIYKKFRQEPELAMFLRTLESLQSELQKHSIILLDSTVLPGVGWLKTNRPQMADMKVDLSQPPQPLPVQEEKKAAPPAEEKKDPAPAAKPVTVSEDKPAPAKPAAPKDDKKAATTRPADDR